MSRLSIDRLFIFRFASVYCVFTSPPPVCARSAGLLPTPPPLITACLPLALNGGATTMHKHKNAHNGVIEDVATEKHKTT